MKNINAMDLRNALLACFVFCAMSLFGGVDYIWVGASGGLWSDTANWEKMDGSACTVAPKVGDSVTFMPGDGVSLLVNGNVNLAIISVSNGNVTVSSSSSYHLLKQETAGAGGRHPHVYVAEGSSLSLAGQRISPAGKETLTKAGGGKLLAEQIAKQYGAICVEGGTLEVSGAINASNIVIGTGCYLCSTHAGSTATFPVSTNITVEAGGKLLVTGGDSYSNAKKQGSVVPVRGAGELCIAGWVKMEDSQLANFTGAITGSGGLVTESGVVLHNISMTGGELDVDGDTDILGGDSTFGGDVVSFNKDNVTLTVRGGFMHQGSISNEYVSTILPDYAGICAKGNCAASATVRVEGGRVHFSGSVNTPGRLELAGGAVEFVAGTYLPRSSFTAENPAVVLFDGGEAVFSPINNYRKDFYPFGNAYYEALSLQVGTGGAAFDDRDAIRGTSKIHFCNPLITADGVAVDGGLKRRGLSTVLFRKPLNLKGPVELLDGVNTIASQSELAASPAFFGTGSFTLENAILDWSSDFTAESSLTLASEATFSYGGIAQLDIAPETTSPAKTIAAGALARKGKGSVLQIVDRAYGLFDDGASRLVFSGGLSTNAAGLVTHPVFIHQAYGWPRYIAFATYDETQGLRALTNSWYDASADNPISSATADRIVRIGEANNNYTLPQAGGACAALFLRNKTFTIRAEYAGLTVGDGVNPALVAIGAGTAGGSGTLDFGTSEGVIYMNGLVNASGDIPWCIAGSSGVTFATRVDTSDFGTTISGVNTYSGGTWITGGDFTPMNSLAFSNGKVTVTGGKYVGGSVNFTDSLVMANAFSISGYGKATQSRGALSFAAGATLTGSVEVDGMARIGVQSDVVAKIEGQVSGGCLEVCGTTGTLALSACNTYTGGTHVAGGVTLRLAQAESAGTGCVTLDNGVLEISGANRALPIVFTNSVDGIGRIVVSGKAPVRFTDKSMAYIGAETVWPGTSVSFPALAESDTVVTDAPPVRGCMLIVL